MHNVCEYWFNKDQNRLRDIRPDTLAQMLNLASIRPGGKYIVVDDASGVVVSAVLERLGGMYIVYHLPVKRIQVPRIEEVESSRYKSIID